ncbi:MAG: InlB B-repeat-containing protein, partial [Aedoeadaptatus pacaensis]
MDKGSIDNPGTKKEITSVKWTPISNNETGNKFRLKSNIIPKTVKGWILVEVETPYMEGLRIGLGSDYRSNTEASTWDSTYKAWIDESYGSESDINCKHLIKVIQGQNGTVAANPASAKANTTVTLTATPSEGYVLDYYTVTNTATQETKTFTGNTFTMPDSDVTVTATFKKKAPPKYKVTVNGMQNGTVTASPTEAEAGKTVQLTVTPAENYQIQSITVTDGQGKIIPVDMRNYTFEMPPSNVSVSATFVEKPPEIYTVRLVSSSPDGGTGGTVGASPTSGKAGTEVTVSATANEGYTLAGISVAAANGVPVTLTNNKFKMPASNVTVTATFTNNPDPQDPGTEIPNGKLAVVKNKQTGLDMKIFKRNFLGTGLKDAIFTLKETGPDFDVKKAKEGGINLRAKSEDKTGRLIFIDGEDNPLSPQPLLPEGYYVLKEETAPSGYKKITAPWNIHIKEDKGQLIAEYYGPEDTASSYLNQVHADASGNPVDKALVKELTTTPSGIKYASRVVNIDPEAKTYRQRVYLDTRAISDTINVQITPLIKREEIDTPGQPPTTTSPGVKTAYRTTYKVADPGVDPPVDSILKSYDLSKDNVSMVNTARWRPFDWGFDEDQLNLKPGVYFIDVEGYYDDNIVDEGNIDIKFDFYRGERTFREATGIDGNGHITYKSRDKVTLHDSYQNGDAKIAEALGANGESWKKQLSPEGKYENWIGKLGGRIYPAVDPKDYKDVDKS